MILADRRSIDEITSELDISHGSAFSIISFGGILCLLGSMRTHVCAQTELIKNLKNPFETWVWRRFVSTMNNNCWWDMDSSLWTRELTVEFSVETFISHKKKYSIYSKHTSGCRKAYGDNILVYGKTLLVYFIRKGETVNSDCYCVLLRKLTPKIKS